MSVEIRGADQLARVAKALRGAPRELRREMYRAINRSVKPVKEDIRASADTLPQRGGLADEVKRAKLSTRTKTSGGEAGVRIVARSRYSLHHLNEGQVRHGPGNEVQRIRPGWFDRPVDAAAPEVRRELTEALDDIARRIDRAG